MRWGGKIAFKDKTGHFQMKWTGLCSEERAVFSGSILTEGCCGAVCNHEPGVETTFSHQEGRQLAEGGVTESFNSSFTNRSKFMDSNGQII